MRPLVLVVWFGCGFAPRIDGVTPPDVDAPVTSDAPPDTVVVARPLYASSDNMLYRVDIDGHTAVQIGNMGQSMDALAFANGMVIGIPSTFDSLMTIDPATAQVVSSVTLSSTHTYWGLTVAGTVIYAATDDSSNNLYTISPTGTVTLVGTFGDSMTVAGDLAWVGNKLYVSLENGSCDPQCIATVNPATGVATPIRTDAPGDMWGLSGYRGQLWALRGSGEIDSVDTTTGALTKSFIASSIDWWEGTE